VSGIEQGDGDAVSLTNAQAAALWAEVSEPMGPCPDDGHRWAEWELNHSGDAEYRLCAHCGEMEQQWIE
jgi:hypothetical protein